MHRERAGASRRGPAAAPAALFAPAVDDAIIPCLLPGPKYRHAGAKLVRVEALDIDLLLRWRRAPVASSRHRVARCQRAPFESADGNGEASGRLKAVSESTAGSDSVSRCWCIPLLPLEIFPGERIGTTLVFWTHRRHPVGGRRRPEPEPWAPAEEHAPRARREPVGAARHRPEFWHGKWRADAPSASLEVLALRVAAASHERDADAHRHLVALAAQRHGLRRLPRHLRSAARWRSAPARPLRLWTSLLGRTVRAHTR